MKLRIRANTLRMRLTKSEVAQFAAAGEVADTTDFGAGRALTYRLRRDDSAAEIAGSYADDQITVSIPAASADRWTSTEEVSLRNGPTGEVEPISILIEKDFACLVEREGEDDSDAYAHPEVAAQ